MTDIVRMTSNHSANLSLLGDITLGSGMGLLGYAHYSLRVPKSSYKSAKVVGQQHKSHPAAMYPLN
jgi:hypothetical protein